MTTLVNNYVDMIDIANAEDPAIGTIIDMLKQENPILQDAVSMPCNDGTKHKHEIVTGYPELTWGELYKGIPQSKGTTQIVTDTTGWVNGRLEVDVRLKDTWKDRYRLIRDKQARMFMGALNNQMASSMFYEDTATTPERFKGLAARYNVRGGGGAGNQVVHGGGSGDDNTSIWFVTWADFATHIIHPDGVTAGIKREDHGKQQTLDAQGNPYFTDVETYEWHMGLVVEDWRYNARIANIDVSAIQANPDLMFPLLRQAYYKLKSRQFARLNGNGEQTNVRQAIYCNRDMLEVMDAACTNEGTSDNFVRLGRTEIEGAEVLTYRGIPIRECEAILNTEAIVPVAA